MRACASFGVSISDATSDTPDDKFCVGRTQFFRIRRRRGGKGRAIAYAGTQHGAQKRFHQIINFTLNEPAGTYVNTERRTFTSTVAITNGTFGRCSRIPTHYGDARPPEKRGNNVRNVSHFVLTPANSSRRAIQAVLLIYSSFSARRRMYVMSSVSGKLIKCNYRPLLLYVSS